MHPENGNGAGPEEPVSADETESAGLRPVAPAEADDGSEISDTDIVFDCPCNLEHYVQAVRNLPPAELADIIARDPEPIVITCHNCGSVYEITKDMLTAK